MIPGVYVYHTLLCYYSQICVLVCTHVLVSHSSYMYTMCCGLVSYHLCMYPATFCGEELVADDM